MVCTTLGYLAYGLQAVRRVLECKWSKQRIQTNKGHLTALSLREQNVLKMDEIEQESKTTCNMKRDCDCRLATQNISNTKSHQKSIQLRFAIRNNTQ